MTHRALIELPSTALASIGRIRIFRVLAWLLGIGALLTALALAFTPWQQSVQGNGRVIAYAPLERQQTIEAPLEGRVVEWYVQEGDLVKKGDPIAELSDNDPQILARLERERAAAKAQVDAASLSITITQAMIASLEVARESAVTTAELRVDIAGSKREGAEQEIEAAKAKRKAAKLNLDRQTNLHDKGLASKRDLELAQQDYDTAEANYQKAKADNKAAKSEVKALSADRKRVDSSNGASVESTRSSLEKLKAEKAKAEAELAKVETRLARQQQMQVVAPRDGTIFRLVAKEGTEIVKAGEALVVLVPDAGDRAVELYVDGNDVPLIDKDRHVRIQFEGWPAVQFVGWPSVAVGTFGGTVAFVDSHDDGNGRFRVVVVPDGDEPWPSDRYLRQGVRANGWVLLNRVSLGFELWRQFNGFPPAVSQDEPGGVAIKDEKSKSK